MKILKKRWMNLTFLTTEITKARREKNKSHSELFFAGAFIFGGIIIFYMLISAALEVL